MFLLSLLPFIKKLDGIPRLELRIERLSSVTRRIQVFKKKNLLQPFNSVSTAYNRSCPPTPSPRAASLDSTHSRNSDTQRIHRDVLYLKRRFTVMSVLLNGFPYYRRRRLFYQFRLRSCILWKISSRYVIAVSLMFVNLCLTFSFLSSL